LRFTLFFD